MNFCFILEHIKLILFPWARALSNFKLITKITIILLRFWRNLCRLDLSRNCVQKRNLQESPRVKKVKDRNLSFNPSLKANLCQMIDGGFCASGSCAENVSGNKVSKDFSAENIDVFYNQSPSATLSESKDPNVRKIPA